MIGHYSHGYLFVGGPMDGQLRRRVHGRMFTVPIQQSISLANPGVGSEAASTVTYVMTREARRRRDSLWVMQPLGEDLGPDYAAWPEKVRERCADIMGVTP